MHPGSLSIKDYTYELPDDRIAKYPLLQRDQSKLLVWEKGNIHETHYAQIAGEIPGNSLLVFNNTKVVEARLLFRKSSGGMIEIFCLEPGEQYADITTAMSQKGRVVWKCLVGGAKKWKEGLLHLTISQADKNITLTAGKADKRNDHYLVEISWDAPALSFAEILHMAGAIPLPPYLNRAAEESDKERYQTIYARHDGSVAAPTAGLHFTETVFASLKARGIGSAFVTLHVGAGTFQPVKSATMQEHEMHAEFIDVTRQCIEQTMQQLPGNIIAVGTTSCRTLESLYWLGRKVFINDTIRPEEVYLGQWEAYEMGENEVDTITALHALLKWMNKYGCDRLLTKTQIIIAPGYRFRVISGLVTNFHQPQSTLLLLVAAITGNDWRVIYNHALANGFRFLSYGDGALLWNVSGEW
jgi:S-adenosylmethionine:tRNA ribosyltransferase-isomerase